MEIWRQLQRSLDWVELHLHEKITVQQMAEQAYLSIFYFQRLFKRTIGLSPAAYVNQRRLAKALTRLAETAEPISSLARTLGFENPETFSRAFKACYGVSPSGQRRLRYCLPRYTKPNLATQYGFGGLNTPLSVGGIVFTLRLVDLEYMRYFSPESSFAHALLEPERELVMMNAPAGFRGSTMMVGRYVVCTLEAESPKALRPALQTVKRYLYAVWSFENEAFLCYPGFEFYCGFLPDGAAHGELWVKIRNNKGALPMENMTIACSRVTLEQPVKVTGLNLQDSGLPITFESLGKMWDKRSFFTEEIRNGIQNTVYPVVEYGVCLNKIPDYVVGRQVSEFQPEQAPYFQYTLPAGEYLKVAFHGDTFEDMVQNRIQEAYTAGKAWAKQNKLALNGEFNVEVYPHETTMTDFPEMYLLYPIKERKAAPRKARE